MPVNVIATMNNVWRMTGQRQVEHTYHREGTDLGALPLARAPGDLVVLLFWGTQDFGFLKVDAWAQNATGAEKTFQPGWTAFQQLCQKQGLPSPDARPNFAFASGLLPINGLLRLRFLVDTDHDGFRQLDKARNNPAVDPILVQVGIRLYSKTAADVCRLTLEIRPGGLPADFVGFAALDLGNAASALAFQAGGVFDGVESVPADNAQLTPARGGIQAVESVIRVDEVPSPPTERNPQPPHPELPNAYDWTIGKVVLQGRGGDGVVFGCKRLLSGPDSDQDMPLQAYPPGSKGQPNRVRVAARIQRRIPGELLLCGLFQRFRQVTAKRLPALALTYPTTFAREEIRRLEEVVARAWCRQAALQQKPEKLEEIRRQQIKLRMDEASAAAFSSLYRTVLGEPGGLTRFCYLYPQGYNLMLYDMGAGTTDLALVRARAVPQGRPTRLEVEVVGRTGLRDFGGDEITVAVFRLLKLLLAQKFGEARGRALPRLPPDGANALVYLDANADLIDELLPTRYDRNRMNEDDRRRRSSAKGLWLLAQEFKHGLEKRAVDDKVPVFGQSEKFSDAFWEEVTRQLDPNQRAELRNTLPGVKLSRQQVDALVRQRIEESVRSCNWLVAHKLTGKAGMEDLHRLEIVGNGARYPLVREVLKEQLHVLSFEDRVRFDAADLKSPVVHGALLALAVREGNPEIQVVFDDRLAERLPFDVGYYNRKGGGYVPLFHEHTLYEDLEPQLIQLPPEDDGQPARQLVLYRHWPGEKNERDRTVDRYHPFLQFPFPQGIRGKVTVSYDLAGGFIAEDEAVAVRKPQSLTPTDIYLAPPERGTL